MICSPSVKSTSHITCFTKSQLQKIASILNKSIKLHQNKADLWNDINFHMSNKCSDEQCWLDYFPLNDLNNSFVPKQPDDWKHNDRTWLTNFDILNVMTQYEKKYRSFKFLGVFPIDFRSTNSLGNCISEQMCSLNIKNIGKSQIGAVFNLDKHNEPGSHWVAIYININPKNPNYGFYYFDSNAMDMPPEIKNFSNVVIEQINNEKFKSYINTVRKQFKGSECGMFCIHFLLQMLKKQKFEDFINNKVYDDDVHKLRSVLFRK